MDESLESRLYEQFPEVFRYSDMERAVDELEGTAPISVDGIQCDDGWYRVIRSLAASISSENDRYRSDEDGKIVSVVQLKEKFGGLRVYLTHQPDFVRGAVRTAERMAEQTCELCGATEGNVRRHDNSGWMKTVCESCAMEWKDVDREVPIWKFTMDCHNCGEETDVVYPYGIGGSHGGSWGSVGAQLAQASYCNVKQVYSDTQDSMVWGNVCEHCGAYQGNYFVYEAAVELGKKHNWREFGDEFIKVDTLTRS